MKTCIDCPADISHRGSRAKRCEKCAEEVLKKQRAKAARRYRSRRSGAGPIPQTAVVPTKASSNYAQVMHRWEERTAGPTRTSVILDPKGQPYSVPEKRAQTNRPGGFFGGITHGGIQNLNSGLGTGSDKTEATFFSPTRFYWRSPLEILYVQSWAGKKFINIPVDDMFIRWRTWKDGDGAEGSAEAMEEAEQRHMIRQRLRMAMRSARAYGSSLMVLVTKEAPLEEPLVIERIRPDDLTSIRVFDRYDADVRNRGNNMDDPDYGKPMSYYLHPTWGGTREVHSSRVLRFDAITPLTDSSFYNYEEDWGVSEFVPVIMALIQDQSFASAIAQMGQEASIPVLGVSDLRETIAGTAGSKEATADEIGAAINQFKSVYHLLMLDKDREDFTRVAIQFGGLADLMDRFHMRLAAAGDIPGTRFMGQSPVGMNATGASDMRNYIMSVEANRENQLYPILPTLDMVLARDAGLKEVPEFEWLSLLEMSDLEKAEAAKAKVDTLSIALHDNVIDESEYRRQLDGDDIFGTLPEEDLPEEEPIPEPMPPGGGSPVPPVQLPLLPDDGE